MARSEEQNRVARERAREKILAAAIEAFAARGVHGSTIAEITHRAGVARGLVNYHFGGKDGLVAEVVDRWFRLLVGFPTANSGSPDERLRGIIDGALAAAAANLPLHRAVLGMQHDPEQLRFFAEAAERNASEVAAAEASVRAIFADRGCADPGLEETMLRTLLEGIVAKCAAAPDAFPLERAAQWVRDRYGVGGDA